VNESALLPPAALARIDPAAGRLGKIFGGGDGPCWLEAGVNNHVVPGAPMALQWRLHPPLARVTLPDVGTSIRLELSLLDGADVVGSLGTFAVPGTSGERTVVPRGTPDVLRRLYTIGTSVIQVRLIGDGAFPGPYITEVPVDINPEIILSSFWRWTIDGGAHQVWNTRYQIVGQLVNRTQFSDLTATIVLTETPADGGAPTVFDHPPVAVPRRPAMTPETAAGVTVTYPPILQDWTWILDGVCLYTGPADRWFGYTISLALVDQFGNAYATTAGANIQVVVPDAKQVAGIHATQLMVSAAVFLVLAVAAAAGYFTAVGAPFLFGVAAALQTSAQLVCTAAKDPPQPDFAFLEPVMAARPELPADDGTATALWRRLAALSARIYGINLALSATQGKLEGARLAGDLEGLRVQTGAYLTMVGDLRDDVATLGAVHSAAPAASELLAMPHDEFVKVATMFGQGPTPDMSDAWTKAGGDPKGLQPTIDRVLALAGSADGGEWDLAALLPDLGAAATFSALEMLRDAAKIVAGPPQLVAPLDDTLVPLEDIRS
jgi:hypothetical protein